jgi:imidazolonepropionase-like amidohydrolase
MGDLGGTRYIDTSRRYIVNVVLRNGTVVDGLGGEPIENGFVVIRDGRIAGVGSLAALDPTLSEDEQYEFIDVEGMLVMPGLINAHEHLDDRYSKGVYAEKAALPVAWKALRCARNGLLALQEGVTTVRDLGCKASMGLQMREAVAEGLVLGPRVVTCGEPISMTGGHGWQMQIEADGEDEVRKATRQLLKAGVDLIKLMASGGYIEQSKDQPWSLQLGEGEMRVAFEEAKKAGKKTTVHAHPPVAIRAAIAAGVDCIEHGALIDQETAELMAREGIFLVPTLAESWVMAERGLELGKSAWLVEECRRHLDARMKRYELAVEAGVRMAVGTDVAGSMAEEMELMHQGGLSAMEVLVAATRGGAELCDIADEVGTLEEDKLADVTVIDGNPLENMGDMRKVRLVFTGGEMHRPEDLAEAIGKHPL